MAFGKCGSLLWPMATGVVDVAAGVDVDAGVWAPEMAADWPLVPEGGLVISRGEPHADNAAVASTGARILK